MSISSRTWRVEIPLAIAVVAMAWWFSSAHVKEFVFPVASITRLVDGTAECPFQYRILVSTVVSWLERAQLLNHFYRVAAMSEWRPAGIRRQALMGGSWIVEGFCVVALFYAMRALIREVVGRRFAIVGALGVFYALPFNYLFARNFPFWYPWDLPAALFIALGMLLMRQRRWLPYYPTLVLALLNRETGVFLVLLMAVTQFGVMRKGVLAAHLAAQALVFIGLRAVLQHTFVCHGGFQYYYTPIIHENLETMSSLGSWWQMCLNFGFLWLPVSCFYRRIPSVFARRALWVVPVHFALVFFTATFVEIRLYGEMIPVVLLAAVALASSLTVARSAHAVEEVGAEPEDLLQPRRRVLDRGA